MGKKKGQVNKQKRSLIPPVGNRGIQKKSHSNQPPPSFVVPNYPQPNPYQLPGYPIFPFPVRLVPGPSPSTGPPPIPPPIPPPSLSTSCFASSSTVPPPPAPSVVLLPSPPIGSPVTPVRNRANKPNRRSSNKKKNSGVVIALPSTPSGPVTDATKKKTQLKYARQLATRANKKKSMTAVIPPVKKEGGAPVFNMFKSIAHQYRTAQKTPDAINVISESEAEDNDDIEEIEPEEREEAANDVTIVDNMSICTVDEVGDQTMRVAVMEEEEKEGEGEVGDVAAVMEEEEEVQAVNRGEEEGEITLVDEGEGDEDEDEEIFCLGEHKSDHVMSEIVIINDDSDVEVEEVASQGSQESESSLMNKAFSEEQPVPPMEKSIIDLSLDEDDNVETDKVASGAELPDFIPLIDGGKKKKDKGKQQSSPFVQPSQPVRNAVQQGNGGVQGQNGSSSTVSSPMVMMTRTKSAKERKREAWRKKAETRSMSLTASPTTVARAVAASTCAFPQTYFASPSTIPLPSAPVPITPLAHLYRFPVSVRFPPSLPPPSAMGLIQTRGFSTSAPQSQPVNFRDYGIHHTPSALAHGIGAPPATLASVLHDEAVGVVRDSLSANGIWRRQWETECLHRSDTKVDPSAAPFRICSYNVLCQKTIANTSYLYRHTKFHPYVLEWAHRWPLIQKELIELNADVFGLQEIQDVHFEEFYEPFMKSLGYICHYQRKSETNHSDGLGIFVRANRFKITSTKTIDFLIPNDNLLNRGNVAQLLRVECLQTGASLIISNTHILFNEKRGDVKLGQIALLMANIHAIRQDDEPVICLGDWNLEPQSDLYNYITSGSLDASRFVSRYGSGQLKEGRNFTVAPMKELPMDTHLKTRMSRDAILYQNEGALLQSLQRSSPSMFSHQIPLASTYAPYKERHVSTFHKDVANPDFIFYTTAGRGEAESRRLRLIRRLAVPPENGIRQNMEPWPNHFVPSDHIPLMAEFYLAK